VGAGYVPHEFEMYGVALAERPKRMTEILTTLRAAFTGEPFEFRGRTVHVRPGPYRPGGPTLLMGGSSEPAARRAARIGDGFIPSTPDVWEFYRDEVLTLGRPDPGPCMIPANRTVALAEDAERGWEQMAPFFLHEMNAYGAWLAEAGMDAPYKEVADADALRATGQYAVLTPDEYVAELKEQPMAFAQLHPLCGGMPIERAWTSLRLFENEVLPAFA
jgi:alkanesulfonate monooxygenase SsuD/methylene tetrahydromethanopterin reductase-like flavin-dependent oxidoreductase (luciferase family)